jgi:hypothetical protein
MDDMSDRIINVISELDEITARLTPEEACRAVDEPTLQLFWREWPHISSWAGSLWRTLNEDILDPAMPATSDFDEVGGSG